MRIDTVRRTRGRMKGLSGALVLLAGLLTPPASLRGFELPKDAVYPRIFSPNGDGINDIVYFDLVNPLLDGIEGRIYDSDGATVADIRFDSYPGGNVERWVWDGLDGNGNAVRAGIYIYEVRGNGKTITGTVVVAK